MILVRCHRAVLLSAIFQYNRLWDTPPLCCVLVIPFVFNHTPLLSPSISLIISHPSLMSIKAAVRCCNYTAQSAVLLNSLQDRSSHTLQNTFSSTDIWPILKVGTACIKSLLWLIWYRNVSKHDRYQYRLNPDCTLRMQVQCLDNILDGTAHLNDSEMTLKKKNKNTSIAQNRLK